MDSTKATAVEGGRPASKPVSSLTDRFWRFLRTEHIYNPAVYMELCVCLARDIDKAIANNEVPSRSCDLPLLLREVQKCKSFLSFRAGFMVLMLSIKSACKIGWFPDKDADDLLLLAKEVQGVFSSAMDINVEPSDSLTYVSTVMSRFYPLMKMNKILVSVQAKPGYGTSLVDFQISRNMVDMQKEKIRLFVARIDHMDTSSCIISPPEVNFLLNGKGVQGRINISMDKKPQHPTNVMGMLSCGVNLLQAIGKFNGSYIIALATMSRKPSSDMELQDYDQSNLPSVDFDSDIMKSSGVSLNCPISQRRIKVPVKGQVCKHYQCFDYDTYLALNLKRPFWRCPYCNLSVCHLDLRIDQSTAKVLREVGEDVVRVVVSKDGSWRPVVEKEVISSMPSPVLNNATSRECGSDQRSRQPTTPVFQNQLAYPNNMHMHQPSVRSSDNESQRNNESQTAVWRLASHQEMTRNIGTFTAPGSSYPRSGTASSTTPNVNGYDRGTTRGGHPPDSYVNTSQASNPGLSYMQHRPPSQNQHISSQAVQSRMAHPSQGLAGSSYVSSSRPPTSQQKQTLNHYSRALDMYLAMNPPSLNTAAPPLAARLSHIQPSIHLQNQQPWLTQASRPSQNPVNSPFPRNPLHQSVGLHQPTMGNRATSPSQNPVNSPFPRNPLQQRDGLQQPTMVDKATNPSQNPVNPPIPGPEKQLQQRDGLQQPTMVNNPSQNPVNSPVPGPENTLQQRDGLQQQPTMVNKVMSPSQNPVNSPVPGPRNPLEQRDGPQQPTTVHQATHPSQNPVNSPVIRQQGQVERSNGTQLPPSAVYSYGMVEQRLRSEREKAENNPTPAVAASDSNWRPCKKMRGSLTGEAYDAALSQFMSPLPPAQPVRPPRPPPGFLPKLAVVSPLSGIVTSQAKASSTSPEHQNPPNP